jgi:hypothetical protein
VLEKTTLFDAAERWWIDQDGVLLGIGIDGPLAGLRHA